MNQNKIEFEIRSKLGAKCMTLTSLVELLNKDLPAHKQTTVQNISNKLKRGSIKYRDVKKIAEVLDYELKWEEK